MTDYLQETGKDFKIRTDCRLCGGSYHEVLRLPDTPLANEYMATSEESLAQDRFPLYLVECDDCGHFQLPVVVDPERLFRDYAYQSGTSPVFREHLRGLAESTHPGPGELVVDIASNDGSLLKEYQRHGCSVLGVDPAMNLARKATREGIPTLDAFFGQEVGEELAKNSGKAKLITALNVMAHVDDLHGIVDGVKALLADDGVFIFEVGYFPEVCRLGLFDTIYHEHLSYHHLGPIKRFFREHGMTLTHSDRVASQGGSIRCYVRNGRVQLDGVTMGDIPDVANLKRKIDTTAAWMNWLEGESFIKVFGVPAKLTTLFAAAGTTPVRAFDDNPLKVGRFIPGTNCQIELSEHIDDADHLLIASWNFADEIMPRLRAQGYRGKFIVPLPELRVYSA